MNSVAREIADMFSGVTMNHGARRVRMYEEERLPLKIVRKCFLGLILAWAAGGAAAEELKIGFVNGERLLDESPQAEAISKKLKQEFGSRENELLTEQQAIKRMEDQLVREGATMTEEQQRQMERDLLARKRDFRRAQDDFRDDVNTRRNEEAGKLLSLVQTTIETIAKEQHYDLVLHAGVAYASERADLTGQVLERLRAAANTGGGKTNAPSRK